MTSNEFSKTEQEFGENENESSIDMHSSNTNVTMRISEIRQICNEVTKQNEFTPEAWKKVKIKVKYKKGDVESVGNYRPIWSLPALYKLFTTTLYSRSYPRLD